MAATWTLPTVDLSTSAHKWTLTLSDFTTSGIETGIPVTSLAQTTTTTTATDTASPTASTIIGDGSGLSSIETLSATDLGHSSLTTTVDSQSSHVNAESPLSTSSTQWNSSSQQPSTLALGPIIGGALGGLGMLLVAILALAWMSCKRRRDGGSSKAQPVELENADTADQDNSAQVEANPVKPELSAASPTVVYSLALNRFGQEGPISSREEGVGTRYELPAGVY